MNELLNSITVKDVFYVVFAMGYMWAEFRVLRKDIARLEKKADESNRVKDRTLELEIWRKMHEKEHSEALHAK